MCTGTPVVEFNDIFFKASGESFEFIHTDFNEKIYLADVNFEEAKAWKEKNDNQKLERKG